MAKKATTRQTAGNRPTGTTSASTGSASTGSTRCVTTRALAESMAVIEERTEELLDAVEQMQRGASDEFTKVWTALGGIAGLDGLAVGLAEIAEVMAPVRSIVPPSTALELEPGVAEAVVIIRDALGGDRDSNFQQLSTAYEAPVSFIGEARAEDAGIDYEEQVA